MEQEKLQHLPASCSGDDVAAALSADGAVIVDSVLAPEYIDDLNVELAPWIDRTSLGPDSFSGKNTRRTGALVARSQRCRELEMHRLALETCKKFLAHATSFQLHLTQVI